KMQFQPLALQSIALNQLVRSENMAVKIANLSPMLRIKVIDTLIERAKKIIEIRLSNVRMFNDYGRRLDEIISDLLEIRLEISSTRVYNCYPQRAARILPIRLLTDRLMRLAASRVQSKNALALAFYENENDVDIRRRLKSFVRTRKVDTVLVDDWTIPTRMTLVHTEDE
ncbi:hypothetical protein PENTCL1PPCAC_30594, partial [Pristionchus entomophagus]